MKTIAILLLVVIPSALLGQGYQLNDFLTYNPVLDQKVEAVLDSLSDEELAGQVIVAAAGGYGKSDAHIEKLVREGKVGGILLLNGEYTEFKNRVSHLDSLSKANNRLPLTYSADAEPSLIKYKIKNSTPVKKAVDHKNREEVVETTDIISKDLNDIGITHNYAPVIDISTTNEAIGNRSFGDNPDSVINWSIEFVKASQANGIVATAKHFPGHGMVKGDTHEKLVFIDGELSEVANYQPLIDAGVLSIMVGHIAVKNNEEYDSPLPATLNERLITELLKDAMGFKGIVITDAMGMGGVKAIDNSGIKALRAGVDILLMPEDEFEQVDKIVVEMDTDEEFRARVEDAARKVIRLKFCLGLIE